MKKIKEILMQMPRAQRRKATAELGKALWADSTPLAQYTNLINLYTCRCKKIAPEKIPVVCKILGVTPNELLDWDGENVTRETVKTA